MSTSNKIFYDFCHGTIMTFAGFFSKGFFVYLYHRLGTEKKLIGGNKNEYYRNKKFD
ncbi:hypothetical protein rsdtw13_24790 [Clostridium sp. TW13]|uniref:Uncharacterized protein n=1 Tax=Inconstantimicrobium mannanitabidum TaxID=1604901 RepID=A0ACB5RDP1_9CLOT|nr:hypothetical protein rsdtw13_24790 [Clostridium sp. TW13]